MLPTRRFLASFLEVTLGQSAIGRSQRQQPERRPPLGLAVKLLGGYATGPASVVHPRSA